MTKPMSTEKMWELYEMSLGTHEEYKEEIKRTQKNSELRYSQARWAAMKRRGFIDRKDLVNKMAVQQQSAHLTASQESELEKKDEAKKIRDIKSYEKAVGSLPDTAELKDELDWVRSHPAMSRLGRGVVNEDGQVVLTDDDVLKPEFCKPAPSKAAVNMLQYYANDPKEFMNKFGTRLMKTETKGEDVTEDDKLREIDDLTEVNSILDRVK